MEAEQKAKTFRKNISQSILHFKDHSENVLFETKGV